MNISVADFAQSQACGFDINKAAECLAQQTTYLRCQRLPWIIYVAIAGLLILVVMDVILLMKIRRERKRITEAGQTPLH